MAWLIAAASTQRGWLRFKNSIRLLSKFTAPSGAKRRSSVHLSRPCTTQPGTRTRGVNPESGVSPGWGHNIYIFFFFCWYGILMCWERGKKSNVKLFFLPLIWKEPQETRALSILTDTGVFRYQCIQSSGRQLQGSGPGYSYVKKVLKRQLCKGRRSAKKKKKINGCQHACASLITVPMKRWGVALGEWGPGSVDLFPRLSVMISPSDRE